MAKKRDIEQRLRKRRRNGACAVETMESLEKLAKSEEAMDLALQRLGDINQQLKNKPPKRINTKDLPKMPELQLIVMEK
jgi:hypothetical protein